MRRMSRRVGFIVPILALAFFVAGCSQRAATPAMPTTAAPVPPEPVPTPSELAPVAPEIRDADYDRAFATMVAERADALLVIASVTDRERIIQLAAKHRLPAIYDWREHVEAGGLMAYGGSVSGFTRAPRSTSIGFSKARTRPICPWSARPRSS